MTFTADLTARVPLGAAALLGDRDLMPTLKLNMQLSHPNSPWPRLAGHSGMLCWFFEGWLAGGGSPLPVNPSRRKEAAETIYLSLSSLLARKIQLPSRKQYIPSARQDVTVA